MTPIARARAAIGKPITYVLGQPPRIIPRGATEAPLPTQADCSGFVFYCFNMERFQPDAVMRRTQWLDTTAIWHDAQVRRKWFEVCDPEPGCLIVYPDKGGRQGHVGIVSEVIDCKVTKVIHCAAGNGRKGNAVQETGPDVFTRRGAITVRRKA